MIRCFSILLCCLLLLSPAKLEAARWYEDYENALEKVSAGQCSPEAIESLGAAVVDKPKPQLGKRSYAQRRIDYLPYLTLAQAHFLCGNIKLAQRYLEKSASYGVASQADLGALRKQIQARLKASQPTPAPAIDGRAVELRYDTALKALSQATAADTRLRKSLDSAATVLESLPESWTSQLNTSGAKIEELRRQIKAQRDSGDLLGLADAATRAASTTLSLEKLQNQVDQSISARREKLEAARATPTPRPLPTAPSTSGPSQAIPTPRESRPEIPDSLYRAAVAYFSGDYDGVLKHLESIDAPDSKMRAASFLLRAAARLNTSRLAEGEGREKLMTLASEDLEQVRALAPGMKPDPSLFPPPLLELFEQLAD